jgi:hypothetical protein
MHRKYCGLYPAKRHKKAWLIALTSPKNTALTPLNMAVGISELLS